MVCGARGLRILTYFEVIWENGLSAASSFGNFNTGLRATHLAEIV
jgi:hypothetical protein